MNLVEISNRFPTELDAIMFMEDRRWGKDVHCAYCNSIEITGRQFDYRYACRDCGRSFSVTTGTMIHNTRLPVKTWMLAFSVITNAKKGISALQLSRDIGVHYETAWTMYHKIRDMMTVENDEKHLKNIVEMDTKQIDISMRKSQKEAKATPHYIPELDEQIEQYEEEGFTFKEGTYKKPYTTAKQRKTGEGASYKKVGGAVQRDGDVVAHVIATTKFSELRKIIQRHVNKDRDKTVLITDTAKGARRMHEMINHIAINHFKLYSYRGLNTNTIESFWAIVERQIVGQHHHVNIEYLEKYVAEAVFKFNHRKDEKDDDDNDMFGMLVDICMCPFGDRVYPAQRAIMLKNKQIPYNR